MTTTIPAHVPPERVIDVDIYNLPAASEDAQLAWGHLRKDHDLVWTPRHGGHWIAVGADLVEHIYKHPEIFSSREFSVPPGSTQLPMKPLQADGSEQKLYRAIIDPAFRPAALQSYQKKARALTVELIEGFRPAGSCEFIGDYALILPLVIFLSIVDLPQEDREELHNHAEAITRNPDLEKRHASFEAVTSYLRGWASKRHAEPGDDLLSRIVHSTALGRPLSEDEVLGMGALLLFGGLDTVTSMMGYIMGFLATHGGHRQWLIDHPEGMPLAIEEMMRRHGVAANVRTPNEDLEIDGVTVRAGDHISTPTCVHGLDERKFPDPLKVDFARAPQPHLTFGAGPHRCPGANLARMEIRILLEEWLARIPEFELDPARPVIQQSGGVNSVTQLPLRWPVSG